MILLDDCNISTSSKISTRALVRCLAISITTSTPLAMLAVFCPSYKLGIGQVGFERSIGDHTIQVISELLTFLQRSVAAGLHTQTEVYFSDLLLENYDILQGTDYRRDLHLTFESFQSRFRECGMPTLSVHLLSSLTELERRIGERGAHNSDALRDQKLFRHVYLRNSAFYAEQLGWQDVRILERTDVLYHSYAEMGRYFRSRNPNYVLYWTESAYERAPLYSTALDKLYPLPVVYARKQ